MAGRRANAMRRGTGFERRMLVKCRVRRHSKGVRRAHPMWQPKWLCCVSSKNSRMPKAHGVKCETVSGCPML